MKVAHGGVIDKVMTKANGERILRAQEDLGWTQSQLAAVRDALIAGTLAAETPWRTWTP